MSDGSGRILITGGRGLLGSTLVPFLKGNGWEVVTCSRHESDVRVDLSDRSRVLDALEEVSPKVIVNLAANTSVDACERDPRIAYTDNVRIVENLAAWMKESGAGSHLVQISTDQVYDGPGPHGEDAVTLTNYYGFSKYAGELAALAVPSTILRTNFVGRSAREGRTSLSDWLVESLIAGREITVFEDVLFSPLSIETLCDFLGRILTERPLGVYNLGSREGASKADFAFALAAELGLPTASLLRSDSSTVSLDAYRPKDMRMDSSRIARRLGIQIPTLAEEIRLIATGYPS